MIALRVVAGVTNHFMLRLPEWVNTVVLILFGLTLLGPGNTFEQPNYSVMAHYASETTWGWALTLTAGLRLLALVVNGTFPRIAPWSLRIRALAATLCCFAWFCISLGLYLGSPISTGWKTYATHLVVDIILAIYLGGKAGQADRGVWNGRT